MGNAVGCAPVLAMVQQGIRVGLGTDGYTTDMFESLKAANLIHKHQQANPSIGSSEVSHMLFTANSQIATMTFRKKIGSLEAGALADLIVIDYDPPTPMTLANIDSHILFGMSGRAVDSTMVNGRFLLKEGQLTGLDEAKIKAKSRELAAKMWKRI
jgi:cytosine/adenosine deaminase-related metal-dependent hydrolase